MSSAKITAPRPRRENTIGRPQPSARWLLLAAALVGLVALLGVAAGPAPEDARFAAPEAQRVIEDWRGNSAGFEPAPRPADE